MKKIFLVNRLVIIVPYKRKLLWASLILNIICGTIFPSVALADDDVNTVSFNSGFLRGLGQDVDVSRYSTKGTVPPGKYRITVLLNNKMRIEQNVRVVEDTENHSTHFCFTSADVKRWGVITERLPNQHDIASQLASNCVIVDKLIPGAVFSMDISSLSGELLIPQAYAGHIQRGYVDPGEWQQGITAGILSYNASVFHSTGYGEAHTDYNVNLNSGLNILGWRFRHNGTFFSSTDSDEKSHYQALNTYGQRDIDSLQSQLTIGEYFTPGNDFDSIPFTGIQLASDDSMLPESERGFAPVIRGTALTNAKVTVSQDNHVIYETTVPPGAFAIDDLYATGYAGDLNVTVTETDGSKHSFVVPFSSVVQMLRPGVSRFNLATGRYRDDSVNNKPWFAQATYRRGISNVLTLYAGTIVSNDYRSGLAGSAIGTPLGALALDATFSDATLSGTSGDNSKKEKKRGTSYRLSYSKRLNSTGTNLALAAYRFSTRDYISFNDFVRSQGGDNMSSSLHERTRFQLSISQPMAEWGDFNASGIRRTYWNGRPDSTTFQLGFNKSFNWGSLGISASREMSDSDANTTWMLTASIPLGSSIRQPTLSTTYTHDNNGNNAIQAQLTGVAGENNQLGYGIYGGYSTPGQDESLGGNVTYRTAYTQLGASYSQNSGNHQYSATASGTAVAYSDGIVFTPDRGETMALVVAKGAAGASLNNGMGNYLDHGGAAIQSGLTPYRYNNIGIDPEGLPVDVELGSTAQRVVPRRGAVVRVDFATTNGIPQLIRVTNVDIPFGAEVVDEEDKTVTLVGQGGIIFVRGEYHSLKVLWGQHNEHACWLKLPDISKHFGNEYQQFDVQCVATKA